jgi:acetoin utilization protein AcuB
MKVRRWMSSPVLTTSPDLPVQLAYRKMVENEVRRLPVVDDEGRIVGILSERDARTVLMPEELTVGSTRAEEDTSPVLVRSAMTRTVFVVGPEENIADAVRLMHNRKVSGLPVVEHGRCIGMITVQDLLEVLLAALDRHLNEVTEEIIEGTLGAPAMRPGKES